MKIYEMRSGGKQHGRCKSDMMTWKKKDLSIGGKGGVRQSGGSAYNIRAAFAWIICLILCHEARFSANFLVEDSSTMA
ncbi:hypothetical protein [Sphingopyxis macrogoltabida]|nr:hypothetical protein [Sphingopyxis macrogoltabida]